MNAGLLAAAADPESTSTLIEVLKLVLGAVTAIAVAYFGSRSLSASKDAKATAVDAKAEATQLRRDIATNHGKRPGEHLETIYDVSEKVHELGKSHEDTQNAIEVIRHEMDELRVDVRTVLRHLVGKGEALDLPEPRVCRRQNCPGNCGWIHNPNHPPTRRG